MSNEKQLREAFQWALEHSPLLKGIEFKMFEAKFFYDDPAFDCVTLRATFRSHENGGMVVMFSPGGRKLKVVVDHNSELLTTLDFKLPKELWSGHEDAMPAQPATLESERDPQNPNARKLFAVPDNN